jgi:hypothetical protein
MKFKKTTARSFPSLQEAECAQFLQHGRGRLAPIVFFKANLS